MMESLTLLVLSSLAATFPTHEHHLFKPLDIRKVKVEGEVGRRIAITVEKNIMKLDLENDFIVRFRQRTAQEGYVGLGKTLDAVIRLAAYTGDPRLEEKRREMVNTVLELQEADGYLGFFRPEARLFELWDMHEMAYLAYALLTEFELVGNEAALQAAQRTINYIMTRWSAEPERIPGNGQITTYMAVTGLDIVLMRLYGYLGKDDYLHFARDFLGLGNWDGKIVSGRWGQIQGHVYAYLARCISQLLLNDYEPQPNLLSNSHKAMAYMLRNNGITIVGACGQHECWHNTQEGSANLGETCATAYSIRWWDHLLRREGKALYANLIERAIYNALFAAQSPDGRRIRYYTPFEGPRRYFDKDTYCCPCNYRRIIAELPQLIYYTIADGCVISQYVQSQATAQLSDGFHIHLAQHTDYPYSNRVQITVLPEKQRYFKLLLRIPASDSPPEIMVNGKPYSADESQNGFLVLAREWQPNDTVEMHIPTRLRLIKGNVAQAGRVAVTYGPLVFTLSRKQNPSLEGEDLRLITIDPATLSGPYPDTTVHPGGLACRIKAWRTTSWYPFAAHDWELQLTEFPDPDGEMVYFHVPNPCDALLTEDFLLHPDRQILEMPQ